MFDTAGVLIGFAKVARAIDSNRNGSDADPSGVELAKALAVIAVEVEHRRRLEEQLLTAIEQERERLGRDLHDDLSQRLAAAGMTLQMTVKKLPSGTPGRTQLEKVGKFARRCNRCGSKPRAGIAPRDLNEPGTSSRARRIGCKGSDAC